MSRVMALVSEATMSTAPMSPPSFPMVLTMRANMPTRFG